MTTPTPPPCTHVRSELLAMCSGELGTNRIVLEASAALGALWPKTRYPEEPEPSAAEGPTAVKAARDTPAAVVALLERVR